MGIITINVIKIIISIICIMNIISTIMMGRCLR